MQEITKRGSSRPPLLVTQPRYSQLMILVQRVSTRSRGSATGSCWRRDSQSVLLSSVRLRPRASNTRYHVRAGQIDSLDPVHFQEGHPRFPQARCKTFGTDITKRRAGKRSLKMEERERRGWFCGSHDTKTSSFIWKLVVTGPN